MADSDSSAPKGPKASPAQTPEKRERSPIAGCTIFLVIGASFLFLLTFSFYSLSKQTKEIKSFTSTEQITTPVTAPAAWPEEKARLDAKLASFGEAVQDAKGETTLELDATDLNLAVGSFDEFEELRETFYVESIGEKEVRVQIAYPLNAAPFSGEEYYYLNGTLVGIPKLVDNEVVLEIHEIEVPGKEVPEGFREGFSPLRLFERYGEHETIAPIMRSLSGVELKDGKVVLTAEPNVVQTRELPDDMSPYFKRAGLLFLALVGGFGLIAFIVTRMGGKKS